MTGGPVARGDAFVFVYGTLRREAGHPMRRWLARCAEPVGRGRMRGHLYDAGAYPGAVAAEDPDAWVIGELHRLTRPDELLAALDAYEGCGPEDEPPLEFVREERAVLLGDRPVVAWVYLYARSVNGLGRIVSGDYFGGSEPPP